MTNSAPPDAQRVLDFWLGPLDSDGCAQPEMRQRWWKKDPALDEEIRSTFGEVHQRLADGEDRSWLAEPKGRLAYVILFDQFSRNMFRDAPGMFASDRLSLAAAKEGVSLGIDSALGLDERCQLYMPFMHSEALDDQHRCVALFEALRDAAPEAHKERIGSNVGYAVRHREIVQRWGRFPHRNAILGRESTAEEIEFLRQPGSSF